MSLKFLTSNGCRCFEVIVEWVVTFFGWKSKSTHTFKLFLELEEEEKNSRTKTNKERRVRYFVLDV
jgi:hypothetical protein